MRFLQVLGRISLISCIHQSFWQAGRLQGDLLSLQAVLWAVCICTHGELSHRMRPLASIHHEKALS